MILLENEDFQHKNRARRGVQNSHKHEKLIHVETLQAENENDYDYISDKQFKSQEAKQAVPTLHTHTHTHTHSHTQPNRH